MEDFPQPDTGKRKRSPAASLVNVPIPFPSQYGSKHSLPGTSISLAEEYPPSKRLRLPMKPPVPDSGLMSLPAGITQTIFSYLDPASLGRLICVTRRFQALLDPRFPLAPDQIFQYEHNGYSSATIPCPVRSQDSIWTTSRRRHAPSMPKPAEGLSERDLFALAFGTVCQFCGQRPPRGTRKFTWHPIRGEPSVCTLWPFKIRSCMQCLAPRLKKVNPRIMLLSCTLVLTRPLGC